MITRARHVLAYSEGFGQVFCQQVVEPVGYQALGFGVYVPQDDLPVQGR